MATVAFRYSPLSPPGPTALVTVLSPVDSISIEDLPALVDTGADQTVIPEAIANRLDLNPKDRELVVGFDGAVQHLITYQLVLQIKNLTAVNFTVICSPLIPHIILSRDILNRYVIRLDGPNQRIEISEPGN